MSQNALIREGTPHGFCGGTLFLFFSTSRGPFGILHPGFCVEFNFKKNCIFRPPKIDSCIRVLVESPEGEGAGGGPWNIGTYPVAWNGHFFGPRNSPMRPF